MQLWNKNRTASSSRVAAAAFAFTSALAATAVPAFNPDYTHTCRPIPDSIRIDGVLDEPHWKGLDTLRLVRNNEPTGGKPSVETLVFTAWSQTRLYVAFVAYSRNLRNTYAKHDDPLYEQDVVEMFIDPDGDSKNYFELEWNCLNASLDFFFTGPRTGTNEAWAPAGMQHAVKVMGTPNKPSDVDTGMVVEISIPWEAMKPWSIKALPPKAGDNLPINYYRIDYANNAKGELIAWAPTGAADFHRPDKFGALIFSATPVTSLFPSRRARPAGRPAAFMDFGASRSPSARRADGRLCPPGAGGTPAAAGASEDSNSPKGHGLRFYRAQDPVGIFSNPAPRDGSAAPALSESDSD